MLQQTPVRAAPDIDWKLFAPLLANAFMVHTVIGIIRVTPLPDHRAQPSGAVAGRHLGRLRAAAGVLGVALAASSIAQRQPGGLDRRRTGPDRRRGVLGWSGSGLNLLAFTIVLGFGHMFCMASHQMLAVRCANLRERGRVRPFYGRGFDRSGAGPVHCGMARWLGAVRPPATCSASA